MPVKRITPSEAAALLEQGWKYIDVRSVPEFEEGHPDGSYNVPYKHQTAHGMTPNLDFLPVMDQCFAKDDQLVIGCRSGVRSLQAATILKKHGFERVVEMRAGLVGESGPTGEITCEGWITLGLPMATAAASGRTYEELKARADGSGAAGR